MPPYKDGAHPTMVAVCSFPQSASPPFACTPPEWATDGLDRAGPSLELLRKGRCERAVPASRHIRRQTGGKERGKKARRKRSLEFLRRYSDCHGERNRKTNITLQNPPIQDIPPSLASATSSWNLECASATSTPARSAQHVAGFLVNKLLRT